MPNIISFVRNTVLGVGLALGLALMPAAVNAEGNCPPGYYPIGGQGVQGCAPIPVGGAGAGGTVQPAPQAPRPAGYWKKTWGAFAMSDASGDMGVTYGQPSKQVAIEDALRKCEKHGAGDCTVAMTYENQCAALAKGPSGSKITTFASAANEVEASSVALKRCEGLTPGACATFHTNCSKPIFHAY